MYFVSSGVKGLKPIGDNSQVQERLPNYFIPFTLKSDQYQISPSASPEL